MPPFLGNGEVRFYFETHVFRDAQETIVSSAGGWWLMAGLLEGLELQTRPAGAATSPPRRHRRRAEGGEEEFL